MKVGLGVGKGRVRVRLAALLSCGPAWRAWRSCRACCWREGGGAARQLPSYTPRGAEAEAEAEAEAPCGGDGERWRGGGKLHRAPAAPAAPGERDAAPPPVPPPPGLESPPPQRLWPRPLPRPSLAGGGGGAVLGVAAAPMALVVHGVQRCRGAGVQGAGLQGCRGAGGAGVTLTLTLP